MGRERGREREREIERERERERDGQTDLTRHCEEYSLSLHPLEYTEEN